MLNYRRGDATDPIVKDGTRIITHVCNDIGKWGKGFVLAVSKRWPEPERVYRSTKIYTLGDIQIVGVGNDIEVVNMIGQHDIHPLDHVPPIRYHAIEQCLERVAVHVHEIARQTFNTVSIHMPRIGCGLAGGDWIKIENIIERILISRRIPVYVYDKK